MKKTILLLLPLLLVGCSNGEESKQYPAINDQQAIMKEYYRQHTSNQSYLSSYVYEVKASYDPTYDAFGSLAPVATANGLYYETTLKNSIGIYSGYFVCNNQMGIYAGNKKDVGSIYQIAENIAFWFRPFDEAGHDNEVELIRRFESKDNDLDTTITDTKTGVGVETSNVSHYFSNNINTDYQSYFLRPLSQPVSSTSKQVSAYSKSDTEIVETYKEDIESTPIENPIHPGDEYKMTVMKQTVGQTTFKQIDKIGWAGTELKETVTYSLVSDYELKLLEEPRIILKEETTVNFTYSSTMQPYPGEAFVYQEKDEKIELYRPSMFLFDGANYYNTGASCDDVSKEYKKLHPEFSGYAYAFSPITLDQGAVYSFACYEDIHADSPRYEAIGYNELTSSAGGTIVSGGIADHNLIKTITTSETYEFIVLVSSTGKKSLIAHLYV